MNPTYDIVILGGGIGGYTAAIRAVQMGKTVAIVERDKLGGTCLHRGCIPSKAYLRSAELFAQMKNSEEFGIVTSGTALDFERVRQRKDSIVEQLHRGVQYLMKKHKIDVYTGNGRIIGPSIFSPRSGSIAVEKADGDIETLVPQQLIIATGSKPRALTGVPFDGERILSSDDALALPTLPKSMLIIGGGVIGVEWASMLHDFGVEVTVVEYEKRLVPLEDEEISLELERLFKKRGIRVLAGSKVIAETVQTSSEGVSLQAESGGERIELTAEMTLVCIGRQPNTEEIGLENTDIKLDNGFIKVNAHMQSAESHIYAVGDVIGGWQLAHAAAHEGIAAIEHIVGQPGHPYPHQLVPRCIYTHPEIASVGWTEAQAKELGHNTKVGKFSFKAIGKALVYGETDGFVKVIADADTNDILGVHMVGAHVTNLISEAALAQVLNATPWEVGQTIHPHPTLSEIMGEAMLAVDGLQIGM